MISVRVYGPVRPGIALVALSEQGLAVHERFANIIPFTRSVEDTEIPVPAENVPTNCCCHDVDPNGDINPVSTSVMTSVPAVAVEMLSELRSSVVGFPSAPPPTTFAMNVPKGVPMPGMPNA